MKLSEMKEIRNTRRNLIGFLHISEINEIKNIIHPIALDEKLSFRNMCDFILDLYKNKQISNKIASKVFEILMNANLDFRTESHRHEAGKIFEYSKEHGGYVFLKNGSRREFNKLNHYID